MATKVGTKYTRDPKNFHGRKSPAWQNLPHVLGDVAKFSSGSNLRQGASSWVKGKTK